MTKLAYAAFALFVSGCATMYQPQGLMGGYSTTQLGPNAFQVSFKGNGYTDTEDANDFALLRSAEVSLSNGFKYFAIVDARTYAKTSSFTTPTTARTTLNSATYGSANAYGGTMNYQSNTTGAATTVFSGGETYTISKPRTTNTILCFATKPEGFAYDAEAVTKSLRAKHGLPPQSIAPIIAPQTPQQLSSATDLAINDAVTKRIADRLGNRGRVTSLTHNRVVLLAGTVPTTSLRTEVERLVATTPNVRAITNQVAVSENVSPSSGSDDTVKSRIETRLSNDMPQATIARLALLVDGGVAYLMGTLSKSEGDAAVEITRTTRGVERVVRAFEIVQ
jgi:osmotically-inducible protein OsmY